MMAYVRKTETLYVIQGNYGYGQGWEDVDSNTDVTRARTNLALYRENEAGIPFRLVCRHVKKAV